METYVVLYFSCSCREEIGREQRLERKTLNKSGFGKTVFVHVEQACSRIIRVYRVLFAGFRYAYLPTHIPLPRVLDNLLETKLEDTHVLAERIM